MKPQCKQSLPTVSNTFKIWIVAIIFFLTSLHLYAIAVLHVGEIVSPVILLSIVLTLVGYLWIQELRDANRLKEINRTLVETQKRLESAEIETITSLVLTEEAKDPYTRGHSKRVTDFSVSIAEELGLSQEEKKVISRAGVLHDIGKLGISDSILKKPGNLTEEEWVIMRDHPRRSVDILRPLEFLKEEKPIILYHHEKYDGTGYPSGLKGEDIPLGARIVAVADMFDAMNSERSYRKPLHPDAIVAELKKASGSQLDPKIVNVFLDLLSKNSELWLR